MSYQDINAATINRWIKEEDWEWGRAISHEDYIKALNGDWNVKLTPGKFVPHEWFGDFKGKKLLGLASGGGQQIPIFTALGAECTVLDNKFHLLADFGGAVLAGRERGTGRGYEFVTWIWDYERVGVSHGHYYEDDFAGAKRDFAVRSGLIPKASLFSNEELTEIYRATDHLLAEDPNLNDKQIRAIQEARIKIEFSVPDLDTQLEHRQDYSPQMEM